jgi:dTDP-4-amino-4,6-dideoxygalactose transaminase
MEPLSSKMMLPCRHNSFGARSPLFINGTMEPIPLVDLKANYRKIKDEVDEAVKGVMDSCYFVGGPTVSNFEKAFAEFTSTKYCVGCNSGTDALYLVMNFLGLSAGDEVITQANTFIATILGASNLGFTVVLCDIDPVTYMIDVTKIEALITSKTKAIIPVHLYGHWYVLLDVNESLFVFLQ